MAESIGDALRAWRESLRRSQTEIARQLKITPARLSNWERGVAEPPRKMLLKLMELGFVPPGMTLQVKETRAPYHTRTTPTQLRILIETVYDENRAATLREDARAELYRLLDLEENGKASAS